MGSVDVVDGRRGLWRSRWAAIGAAVAVTLGGGGLVAVQAASSVPSSVVTIDPVRILDTRTDVGLPGPFVSAVSQKLQVTGAAVPVGATGVLLNVTVVSPSADGFLSVRPGDATGTPSTSSLNFTAGQLVPNSVQVGLPTSGGNSGQIDITYDAFGQAGPTTEVLIDVVGYMVAGAPGPAGPTGPAGPAGTPGATGPRGVSAWDVIPSGQTVVGVVSENESTQFGAYRSIWVQLPARAPVALTETAVNWRSPSASDDDASCTGSYSAPTAPSGKVCVYSVPVVSNAAPSDAGQLGGPGGQASFVAFEVRYNAPPTSVLKAVWAYTAP